MSSSALIDAFEKLIERDYKETVAPPPIITPFGIKQLDVLLGGGMSSSLPVAFSSTPESGKSTIAWQFAKSFLDSDENAIVFYADIEGASNSTEKSEFIQSRMDTFKIDSSRCIYKSLLMDSTQIFDLLSKMVDFKQKVEEKKQYHIPMLFIWDSIASTPSSKDLSADDPNSVIGFKARELTHLLQRYKPLLAFNKITSIFIDQVRANMQINSSPYQKQPEKSTGNFSNEFKAATNISSLHHNLRQWLFFSKGSKLNTSDTYGVDGWILNVYTEKNKLAPSQYSVDVVFDKKYGIDKLWSEYHFLSEMTKTEKKLFKNDANKLSYPLSIKTSAKSRFLEVVNPETGEIYTSDKFSERKFKEKYYKEKSFQKLFNYAIETATKERITNYLFKYEESVKEEIKEQEQEKEDNNVNNNDEIKKD